MKFSPDQLTDILNHLANQVNEAPHKIMTLELTIETILQIDLSSTKKGGVLMKTIIDCLHMLISLFTKTNETGDENSSSISFSIELAIQYAQRTFSRLGGLSKKGDNSLVPDVKSLTQKMWSLGLRQRAISLINIEEDKEQDPFSQFIMDVDEGEPADG
jgi:hypothetical protein